METISHLNLKVDGVPFISIQQIEIRHRVNEHAVAVVSGEIEHAIAQEYIQRVDERQQIRIMTNAEGQPSILFWGVVHDVGIKMQNEYALLTLTLKSLSVMSDLERRIKAFRILG